MRCPHCCLWRLWAVSGEKPLSGETNSEAQGSSLENSQWSPLFVEYRLRAIIHPRRLKTAFYGAPHSQGSRYNQREPGSWGEGRGWRERWKVTTTPPVATAAQKETWTKLAVPRPWGSTATGTQQREHERLGASGFTSTCCTSQTTKVIRPCQVQHHSGHPAARGAGVSLHRRFLET